MAAAGRFIASFYLRPGGLFPKTYVSSVVRSITVGLEVWRGTGLLLTDR